MTAPGAWGLLPPEENSAGFWLGPGAESFMMSAAQLAAVAASIIANLGGHEAVAAAMAASWPDPTGEFAVLANVPHLLWQAAIAGMLGQAGEAVAQTGTAFETLKAATPTPVEIGANQAEHVALNMANFLGMLFPAIAANRARYGDMWVTSASNKYSYAAASEAGVGAIPPLPPPPPTTAGGAGAPPAAQMPTGKLADSMVSGGGAESAMSMFMGPLSSVSQMAGGGGPAQGLMSLPQQAMSPFQSLIGSMGSMGSMGNPADAMAAGAPGWLTATPAAGGPVAANLVSSGAGGGGFGGLGALRGPVGWASTPTINAAASASPDAAPISRLGEARAAMGAPVNSAGMGGTGGMMGPMMGGGGEQDKQEAKQRKASPLTSLATLYRAPEGVPVITGSGGAVFGPREGGGGHET